MAIDAPAANARGTDVLVVGGGPAGLAAAIATRRAGFRVVLAEPRMPPIDKACGEGIMPDGVAVLTQLGVHLPFGASVPFTGIRFCEDGVSVRGLFPGAPGLGVRRTVLHGTLVRRAESLGVELRWGSRMTGLHPEGALLDGEFVRARWVVGADGRNSRLRRELGLDTAPDSKRFGIRRHYEVRAW